MKIRFTPMRRDDQLELSVSGDVLTINGEVFDFGAIPEGATLPRDAVICEWLASDVERSGGEISLALILPHGADDPDQVRFPQPVEISEGPVPLPGPNPEQLEALT